MRADGGERVYLDEESRSQHAAVSLFDQPARVARFKLVHALWRRQRMEVLPGRGPGGAAGLVCAWPARGIPEVRVEIDAGLVLEAAAAAVPFFAEASS